MPRPEKTTVEYFSHDVKSGQTLFVIESMYGNDGYAFWFKLLEIVGGCDGHSFNCGNAINWRFLIAKTRVDESTAISIMDTLVELEAIDPELWREHRIVWIQKFVDRLSKLYEKRVEKPQRPCFGSDNQTENEFPTRKPQNNVVSDAETLQSKVKESKEKDSRSSTPLPPPPIPFPLQDVAYGQVSDAYRQNIGELTPMAAEKLGHHLDELREWRNEAVALLLMIAAMQEAVDHDKRNMAYVSKVLNRWQAEEIDSVEKLEARRRIWENGKLGTGPPKERPLLYD